MDTQTPVDQLFCYDIEIPEYVQMKFDNYKEKYKKRYNTDEPPCNCQSLEECCYFKVKYKENENNKNLLIEYMNKISELYNRLNAIGISCTSYKDHASDKDYINNCVSNNCVSNKEEYTMYIDYSYKEMNRLIKYVFKETKERRFFTMEFRYISNNTRLVKSEAIDSMALICQDLELSIEKKVDYALTLFAINYYPKLKIGLKNKVRRRLIFP